MFVIRFVVRKKRTNMRCQLRATGLLSRTIRAVVSITWRRQGQQAEALQLVVCDTRVGKLAGLAPERSSG
jgi:hypothetical protein